MNVPTQVPPEELQAVMPAGALATVSLAGPTAVTVRLNCFVKVALTAIADAPTVIEQEPVPGQLTPVPDQPVKTDPATGAAERVTTVPLGNVTVQPEVEPVVQLIWLP